MCKSIDEMMEKLKFLNLQICFDTSFSTNQVKIKFLSKDIFLKKGKTFIDIEISKIDQKIEIEFLGYIPEDSQQKTIVEIYYQDKKLDSVSLCKFQMKDNLYVENILLEKYNEIHFNGKLSINFFKEWFECNILNGATLSLNDTTLISWTTEYKKLQTKQADIFCIGDSFTIGQGVNKEENWPSLLESNINCGVENIGSGGLSADGCFFNTKYILDTFKPKIIICLLPTRVRKIFKFKFLNFYGFISISIHNNFSMPPILQDYIEKIKNIELLDDQYTKNNWISSCKNIIKSCKNKKVKCFLSTWDEEMYEHIPANVRLPKFPNLKIFKERATDGHHPHKKHYKAFVNSILPYIQ